MFTRELAGFYLRGIFSVGIAFMISMIMIAVREDGRGIQNLIGGTYVAEGNQYELRGLTRKKIGQPLLY